MSAKQVAQKSVDRLKSAIAQSAADDQKKVQLIELKEQVKAKQVLLEQLEKQNQLSPNGMSEHFIALARQDVRGLWLSRVEIEDYGQKIALFGEAADPERLADYLQRLSKEPAFDNISFKLFKLDKEDEGITSRPGKTLGFIVSTHDLPNGVQLALKSLAESKQ